MDVHVVLFFMSTLLWKVHSLKCIKCIPESETSLNCTNTEMDCPNGKCLSLGITSYTVGLKANHINMKFCSTPGQCPSGTINYGMVVSSYKSQCCGTNLCNAQDMPDIPLVSSKNGQKCFTCAGPDCSSTVDCLGDENRCIKSRVITGSGVTMTLKGCASENLCGASQSQVLPNIHTSSVCCEGSLCNHGEHSRFALALLLMALSSLILTL
ncbi:phospholipase A2 inhibitor gamma subunit B-like isoform X1 [Alosa alosa]|uniref:phospholipase A2 inhibitor gamma subunit B-like isoform X1 n=1 Tax=Alosa alosa TaxID=278164 RepID=UPI0020153B70|nr:phospholipase A2 inhibitor gamma subunit B-like isoform X1 [Alosa alosa]